jgi:hypothetical protein
VDRVDVAVRPVGISGIVGLDGNAPARRVDCEPLHHQHVVRAKHVNAIAEPIHRVPEVDEDVVAGVQRRSHGIAFDPDDRQFRSG